MTAVNANEFTLPPTATYTVKVIVDDPNTTVDPDGTAGTRSADESLGCDVQSFGGPLPPNTIAVVNRGMCARVAKAIFGQQAGAEAVVMVNNDDRPAAGRGPDHEQPGHGRAVQRHDPVPRGSWPADDADVRRRPAPRRQRPVGNA